MQAFTRMAAFIDGPQSQRTAAQGHPQCPFFPMRMEKRFICLRRNRTEAHVPTQIMRTIHVPMSTRPVPIMESRVTRAARASSL